MIYIFYILLMLAVLYGLCYLLATPFTKVEKNRRSGAGVIMAVIWIGMFITMTKWESTIMGALGLYGEMHMFIGLLFPVLSIPVIIAGFFCLIALLADPSKEK